MKTNKLAIAIAILMIIVVSGCTTTPTGQVTKEEEIKIGVIAPLTGVVSWFGDYMRQSFDMAVEEVNAKGGVNGKKIKLIYEDTQCIDLKATTTALKKFKEIDDVAAVLGPYCGSTTSVAGQFSTDNKFFIISSGDNLGKAGNYMVTTRFRLEKEGQLLAKHALEQGWNKVGIIYYTNDWGQTYRDSVKAYLEEHGGELVSDETYGYNNIDIRTLLLKTKQAGAQAIVIIDGTGGKLFKQVKELGIDLPLLSEWEIENPAHKGVALGGQEGVHYFFPVYEKTSFHQRFEERYNIEPNVANLNAYDAAIILTKALEACPDYNNDCMLNYVINLKDYLGAGGKMTFDKETWSFDKEFALKQVKDGKYVFVEE